MKIRQLAPDISGIRDDHVARYRWAIQYAQANLESMVRVLDVGCGCGYGSKMLAEAGASDVTGFDADWPTLEFAHKHYGHPAVRYIHMNMASRGVLEGRFNFATMFEVIEHSQHAPAFLEHISYFTNYLFGSVPNEEVVPYMPGKSNAEHYRHYTSAELIAELENSGWHVAQLFGQAGKVGEAANVGPFSSKQTRTIVFLAESKQW